MEFKEFKKIPRLSREIIISEKIDGSNGQIFIYSPKDKLRFPFSDERDIPSQEFIDEYCVYIHPENPHVEEDDKLYLFAGSRNRWLKIGKQSDNHGFASWVKEHGAELVMLGEGRHYGEYYGKSIQRGYGLDHKRFALFNVSKWHDKRLEKRLISVNEKTGEETYTEVAPDCCEVVPILYEGEFCTETINGVLGILKTVGSKAVPGFMKPEGICIFHTAAGQYFKKTIENDSQPKGVTNG
jgi:hypothetical protein